MYCQFIVRSKYQLIVNHCSFLASLLLLLPGLSLLPGQTHSDALARLSELQNTAEVKKIFVQFFWPFCGIN